MRLGATIDVEHSNVRFLNNLVLNLWDCGGQEAFMEHYFSSQRDHIFRNVEVLIYVFDVESRETQRDLRDYRSCLEAILQNSNDAKIFCLIHKMDLVKEDQREAIFAKKNAELQQISLPLNITCFQTSIWDETLYKAWSAIVHSLVPNIRMLESHLNTFCDVCEADEVVLFERATFLVISHSSNEDRRSRDVHRFEKISNIIKQFKLSCSKSHSQFRSMEVRNADFVAFIEELTGNTYMMVVVSDDTVQSEATRINIAAARTHFEQLFLTQMSAQ